MKTLFVFRFVFFFTLILPVIVFAQDQNSDGCDAIKAHLESDELQASMSQQFQLSNMDKDAFATIYSKPRFQSDLLQSPLNLTNIDQLKMLKDLLDIIPSDNVFINTKRLGFGGSYCNGTFDPCVFSNPKNNHKIENKLSVNYLVGGASVISGPSAFPEPIFDINVSNICNNSAERVFYVNALKQFGFGTNEPASTYHFVKADFQFGDNNKLMFKLTDADQNESLTLSKNGYHLFKVSKDGKVWAREFEVNLVNPFPDYVFDKNYELRSIESLEQYVETNHHLPGLNSAADYEKEGVVNIGELNLKMLEKIEEMSLYIIQQQHKIDELNCVVQSLIKN
jgi:hypothetical protein